MTHLVMVMHLLMVMLMHSVVGGGKGAMHLVMHGDDAFGDGDGDDAFGDGRGRGRDAFGDGDSENAFGAAW